MNFIKRFTINTLLVLASLLLTIAMVETTLRFTKYQAFANMYNYSLPKDYFRKDDVSEYDIRSGVKDEIHRFADGQRCAATVETIPFVDPTKSRVRA